MNSSVPSVSPPLITAALTRIATMTPTIPQNSVVLNACFVSVVRRRSLPLRRVGSVRTAPDLVAASMRSLFLLVRYAAWAVQADRGGSHLPLCSQTNGQVTIALSEASCLAQLGYPPLHHPNACSGSFCEPR